MKNPATHRWLRVTGEGGADADAEGKFQEEWKGERLQFVSVGTDLGVPPGAEEVHVIVWV